MIRSIYTINRNMNILQKKQENISANMANLNTPGYKFQNIVQKTLESYEMINHAGGPYLNQRQVLGDFVFGNEIDEMYRDLQQGNLYETEKQTDFAIVGNGFFNIEMDNGQLAYTRNGNFKLNEANQLVTMEGYRVLGRNNNGQIGYLYGPNINVNNILISDFNDYQNLNNIGDTLFTGAGGNYLANPEVRQGMLEMSNIQLADELVRLIQVSREFESNQKLLHTADETLEKAVNEIGRV